MATTPKVLVTRLIPEPGLALLTGANLQVELNSGGPLGRDELVRRVSGVDAVVCQPTDMIDREVLAAAAGHCRVFGQCAVGFDNIDVQAAAELGIVITNTPGVLTETTADLAFALLLAAARRLGESERVLRSGLWRGWGMLDFLGVDVHHAVLGIVGAGRIGQAVARRAAGFNMTIQYYARSEKPEMSAIGGVRKDLAELMESSDFVSVHLPLTPETRGLIDAKLLGRMKRSAIFVNTSRGAVVDQDALIEALRDKRIAAAGLDVYTNEPAVPESLVQLENVVLLPHIGSATIATRTKMALMAASNVIAVLEGHSPINPVRPPVTAR